MKKLFGGTTIEAQMHSPHSECKYVQKSVLTNVNWQRTGKTSLQMFVYFIFDGSFICRFLPILCPSDVHRHNFHPPKIMLYRCLSAFYICRFYILRRKVEFLRGEIGLVYPSLYITRTKLNRFPKGDFYFITKRNSLKTKVKLYKNAYFSTKCLVIS